MGGRRPYVPVIGPGAPGVTAAWVTRSNFRIARPWNSSERMSLGRLRRAFLSRPDMSRAAGNTRGCAGGLCTIAAQVAPARRP